MIHYEHYSMDGTVSVPPSTQHLQVVNGDNNQLREAPAKTLNIQSGEGA